MSQQYITVHVWFNEMEEIISNFCSSISEPELYFLLPFAVPPESYFIFYRIFHNNNSNTYCVINNTY
jgi:hypothetical protein